MAETDTSPLPWSESIPGGFAVLSKLRANLTYANVMATSAVFIALGGSSYAAIQVTGKNVKDSSLTGKDIKSSSLTSSDVKNRSLLGVDFKSGQLPSGPQGTQGTQGPKGDPGPLLETLPPGKTLRGVFATRDTDNTQGARAYDSITFSIPLAAAPTAHYLNEGSAPTADCPGSPASPEAAPGHLCVYERTASAVSRTVLDPISGDNPGSSRYGAVVFSSNTNETATYGTWAVKAP